MMRNIELKARLQDRERAMAACERLKATPKGELHQTDTYFRVAEGRLKLRDFGEGPAELIFYHRPDTMGPKTSRYDIAMVEAATAGVLADALGVVAVVTKTRTLFLWKNVRIHLDEVQGLGDFLEFEAVLGDEDTEDFGRKQVAQLRLQFGISDADLLASSYVDLIQEIQTPSHSADATNPRVEDAPIV